MADLAIALMIAYINNAAAISTAMRQAHAEGREMNADDWAAIDARDDVAVAKAAIAQERAKAEGR